MKKLLMATGVLLAAGGALAQSSVTIFGIVDAGFSYGSGSESNTNSIGTGNSSTSRFGFRGIEDLGGGLKAGFWLESQVNVDNGSGGSTNLNNADTDVAGLFGRRSTISLMGGFGEVRIGRDLTANYIVRAMADPFGSVGVGVSQTHAGKIGGVTSVRASNMVGYSTPAKLGGFKGQVQYFAGESQTNNASRNNGDGYSVRAEYEVGSLTLAAANGKTKFAPTTAMGDVNNNSIYAAYTIGNGEIAAGYTEEKVARTLPIKASGGIISGVYNSGVNSFKVAFSTYGTDAVGDPKTHKLAFGMVRSLSKRTSLYGTLATVSNKGGAKTALNQSVNAANQSSSGFDVGIRHTF